MLKEMGEGTKSYMAAFAIDETSDLPLWVQIKNRMAYLINTNVYEPHSQLPSVRSLAAELQISYNTVSKAYMALEREGYIETRHGSGAYVRPLDAAEGDPAINTMVEDFISACMAQGMDYDDIVMQVNNSIRRRKRGGHA